jgi:iron complex outermembrane receptor protein
MMRIRHSLLPALACLGFFSGPLQAQAIAFNVPEQAAATGIPEFARQADIQILVTGGAVSGKRTGAVLGSYTVQDGLARLLAGTDLSIASNDGSTITLEAVVSKVRTAGTEEAAGPAAAEPEMDPPADTLEEVMVFGRGVSEPTRQIPQTVSTFDQSLLLANTTGVTLENVARFVPSASALVAEYGINFFVSVRGFRASQIWNGMTLRTNNQSPALSNVERVEVLMGPASVLYGSMEPGGVFNLVTKQPTRDFLLSASTEIGSYNAFGGAVDVGGPISDRARARLNVSYDTTGAQFDHYRREKTSIAPVIAFDLTDDTLLTVEGHYLRTAWPKGFYENSKPVAGTLEPNPPFGEIPESANPAYVPGISGAVYDSYDLSARLSHAIGEDSSLNAALAYHRNRRDEMSIFSGFGFEPDGRSVARFPYDVVGDADDYTAHVDYKGTLEMGSVRHQYMLGLDYKRYHSRDDQYDATLALDNIDLYLPVYGGENLGPLLLTQYELRSEAREAFVQDRLHIGERLTLLGGARYTRFKDRDASVAAAQIDNSAVSTQFGVVYEPAPWISLFASRNEAFVPRFIANLTGEPFDPEESLQYEAGAKFDIGATGLTGNVTYYFIEKPNVLAQAPDDPANLIPVGEVQAKGFELSVRGQPAPGWGVYAGYGYNRTEVTEATEFAVTGSEFGNAPRHTFSLISNYEFASGGLRGVSVNGAVQYMGTRWSDAANTLELPAYTRIDLSVAYPLSDKLTVSVHGNHLTDETIYSNAFSPDWVYIGVGRTFTARLRYQY